MSTMVCGNCGKAGICWMGPASNMTHTECPHCSGQNCQRMNDQYIEDDDDVEYEDDFDCGMTPDGTCQLAGSEFCDWECPRSR